MEIKVGMIIYVDTHLHISSGSDDVRGGLAEITEIEKVEHIDGSVTLFISVKEHPGHKYNWTQVLAKEQDKLKKEFGSIRARPDPDIDTPWIEDGDTVFTKNGSEIYHGKPIW